MDEAGWTAGIVVHLNPTPFMFGPDPFSDFLDPWELVLLSGQPEEAVGSAETFIPARVVFNHRQ